uniref:Uncharacterized protein n=1 Tax=Fagus sylvatica TaxID=28930 RepID=A0A2N9GLE6_FAGSY
MFLILIISSSKLFMYCGEVLKGIMENAGFLIWTDMDILDLFPKYRRTTFQRLKKEDLPNTQMKDDHLWGITNSSNSPKPNPHPLRESRETAHRADSPPATGVFHESREPSPCTSHSTTNQTSTGLPSEGLLMLHMSSDPTTPGRPRAMNREAYKAFSLSSPQVFHPQARLTAVTDFPATSVGAVCGKRVSAFTTPIRKDCMVRTRSMEVNAQLLPSSSQSPEMAAMEKQVRDLTANLQELTRQNQTLNQKLQQHETEKEKQRDKGKSKERGDAESRQEQQHEQQQEQQQEHRQEQEDETKGEHTRVPYEESSAKWEQEIRAMKAQLGEMKDEFKGRATRNLDTLVHRTDSPFTEKVISFPLPSKFRMPSLENFDGTKDPLDHLESFKTMMCLQGVPDEIMCRAFPTTLKGPARIWFKKLIPGSVGSFAQLSHSFFNHFIGGQRCGRPTTHLLNVRQREGETLRSYLTRFNKETLLVDGADDKVVLTAFISGLQSGDFLFSVYKDPPTSMSEMMDQREGRPPQARPQRPPVEDRPRPPMGEIHMINGGMAAGGTSRSSRKAYARQIHNVLVTQKANKTPRLEDLPITFTEEDARKVVHPHDDAFGRHSGNRSVYPLGIISLQIIAGTYPKQATKRVEFLVVDCPSAYNVIIGRPTLNRLRAVTSTYHLLVRFPTEHGIGEMKGDQAIARECYLTSTRIGTTMPAEIRGSIVQFLRENADVFAWSHEDMPGMPPVMAEVDKLLTAGFIREVYYPEWLANVVMVKKPNGKWRMCVDFTDLNKACPKDSYPLPRIDQLVDSTAGHKLLSFMDAFSGYNQIRMEEEDQEKTAFITSRGLFCYKVMPFGLKNAGATYQRLVNKMFHDQIGRNVEVYVDDMLVKSKENEDHLKDLKETFQALRTYNMKLNPEKCAFGAILEMSPPTTVKEVQSLTGKAAALNRFVSRSTDKCLPFFKVLRKAFQWTEECQRAFEELKVYLSSPPLLSPSKTGEELYLYLAISSSAVSSALIREEERVQKPVYYTSRALKGAEERYSNMEKLAFALLIASRKLRPYFQAHSIVVLTDYPLRKAMNKPDAAGRLIQWSIEMSEFDIDYRPRTAIKAQALADFIAEFTHPWEEEGIILVSPEKDKFEYAIQLRFRATNNEAEYEALLAGLKLSKKMGVKNLTVKSDSQLVVGQIKGEYEAREDRMKKYLKVVQTLLPHFQKVEFVQIPREENVDADRLARLASSGEEKKANYVIREVHEGICGNHSGARALAHKLTRAGYYWPSLLHDAAQYVKTCDKCQRFANIPRAPPEEITPMTSPWPFSQWGLDIMGPFPVGTKQAKFLVVAIDYFTKWVEAEPLATITEKNVKNFVWKGVICRFGIPRVLVSDNGKQFDNGPFRDLCAQLNIKNHYSSPRHPQANGQVEVTNRTLLKQIKTRLEGAKGLWVEELPSILWAYRTTVRVPTGETPFKLTFGTEAVIPVEIGLTTLRTTFHKEEENEGQLRLNLDLLDETRDKAARRITLYQEKMAKYYNTKVKLRRFEIGDWKGDLPPRRPSWKKASLIPGMLNTSKSTIPEHIYLRSEYYHSPNPVRHPRGAKSRRESSKQMPLGGQLDTHEVQSPEGSHRNRCPSEDSQTPTRCKVQKGVIETDAPRRTVQTPTRCKVQKGVIETDAPRRTVQTPTRCKVQKGVIETDAPRRTVQTPTRCKVQKGVIETDAPRRTVRHPRGACYERKVVQKTPSFQFSTVRHPRGACYEGRSSRRRPPSNFLQLDTHVVHVMKGRSSRRRPPSNFLQLDTHVVHVMKEGRPEDALLPVLSS